MKPRPTIGVDTIKIELPYSTLKNFDKSKFRHRFEDDAETGELFEESEYYLFKSEIRNKTLGVNWLNIYPAREYIDLEFSAKFLKKKYLDNINESNVSQIFDYLRHEEIADFETSRALQEAIVLRIDVVANLILSKPPQKYIDTLKLLSCHGNYYKVDHLTSIEILSAAETNNFHFSGYWKHPEMDSGGWSNNEILQFVPLEKFENIVRLESSIKGFESIRTAFGLLEGQKTKLMTLLQSDKEVLYDVFVNNINTEFLKSQPLDIFSRSLGLGNIVRRLGYMWLAKFFNRNEKLLRNYIKTHVLPNKNYRQYQKDAINDSSREIVGENYLLIEEMLKALL